MSVCPICKLLPSDHDTYADRCALIREAINVRWLIYSGGGNASKTAVEDVLLMRHVHLDRAEVHEIMNHIEYHDLLSRTIRSRAWCETWPEPTRADWPEIGNCTTIKWWKK
jgi:hypothetical protein